MIIIGLSDYLEKNMTNNFVHLIQIPMTGVGIRPFRGQEWYRYRIDIFKRYTLNSLLCQTNRNFVLWLAFRPEEKDNPLTLELEEYLKQKGVVAFMTFDGLPYWDDKFGGGLKEKLLNLFRVVRMAYQDRDSRPVHNFPSFIRMLLTNRPPLKFGWGKVIKELFHDKNGTIKDRLSIMLPELQKNFSDNFDWVYVSRIDSDDMFSQDFVQEVHTYPPFPGALTCRKGYVYDSNTGKLAEWNPKTNPPFHTIIFPKENFFDPARYLQYFKGFKSHEDIPSVFHSQNLKDGKYCVLIHKRHISTCFDHPWRGKEIVDEKEIKPGGIIHVDDPKSIKIKDKNEILNNFGILEPGYFEMDGHKFLRVLDEPNQALREIVGDYLAHKRQNRTYEPETMKVIKENVKEGDVCVDVGASIGYVTLQLARQAGKTGKVLAFEPTDNQCEYIKKNVKLNGYENVEVHNLAAYDKTEDNFVRRDTVMNDKMEGLLNNPKRIQVNAGFEKRISGVALDDVLPEKVDFIKMDIDGSEPRALKGLIKTFERNPQLKMVIEFYPEVQKKLGNNPDEMMAIINRYFHWEKIPNDYNEEYYNIICRRK